MTHQLVTKQPRSSWSVELFLFLFSFPIATSSLQHLPYKLVILGVHACYSRWRQVELPIYNVNNPCMLIWLLFSKCSTSHCNCMSSHIYMYAFQGNNIVHCLYYPSRISCVTANMMSAVVGSLSIALSTLKKAVAWVLQYLHIAPTSSHMCCKVQGNSLQAREKLFHCSHA